MTAADAVLLVGGHAGTGKTTLASNLRQSAGALVLSNRAVREELGADGRLNDDGQLGLVHRMAAQRLEQAIGAYHGVVVHDSTKLQRPGMDDPILDTARRTCAATGRRLLKVCLTAAPEVLRGRLEERSHQPGRSEQQRQADLYLLHTEFDRMLASSCVGSGWHVIDTSRVSARDVHDLVWKLIIGTGEDGQ